MSERNINALMDALKSHVDAHIDDKDAMELTTVGLELLRQFLIDVGRCADALEVLATEKIERKLDALR